MIPVSHGVCAWANKEQDGIVMGKHDSKKRREERSMKQGRQEEGARPNVPHAYQTNDA